VRGSFSSGDYQYDAKINKLGGAISTELGRTKRQFLAPIAFLAGLYTSNVLSTAKELLVGQSSIKQRINFVTASASKLNAQMDLSALARQAVVHGMRILKAQISWLEQQQLDYQDLSVVEAYVISCIIAKRELLNRFYYSYKERKADVVTLPQLLGHTRINQLELADAVIPSISAPGSGVLQITLNGPIRSQDTFVYDVHAIPHYVNVTSNPAK